MLTKWIVSFMAVLSLPVLAGVNIQHWVTPEGARVYFVENHDIPMLDVAVDFPAGSRFESAQNNGLARLAHALLDQGAADMDDLAISSGLADVGALLGGTFDRDRAGVSLRTLSTARERDAALNIFIKVLQQPRFEQTVLERERARLISALREEESRPGEVADKAFYAALYGQQGYGLHDSGTEQSLASLKPEDLHAWYRAHYRVGSAVISLIGDLDRAAAEALAQRISAGLTAGVAAEPPMQNLAYTASTQRIEHPSSQSHVLLGLVGMARNDADFFPLFVGNHVLGGSGFDSRMLGEVRQKRGYAYSAYSYFIPMSLPGPFIVGLQTRNAQADDALKVARQTVQDFVRDGPTEAELKQAKANLIGGFPLRIDSNRKILDFLRMIGFYRLPLAYLDDWVGKVEAVGIEHIREAFRRRVDPAAMSVIIVGGKE